MTECERLIAEGKISKNFFREEMRCNFWVDKERKKVWAVHLDLLNQFNQICLRHGLKYFLMFGSLLGAIRHKGFIPWDDDIDVGLFRSDYEKLLNLDWEKEVVYPYFFQSVKTEEDHYNEYWYSFSKFRNSNTTYIRSPLRYAKFNHGMVLDIFPIDNVLLDDQKQYDSIKKLCIDNSLYMKKTNPFPTEQEIELFAKHSGREPKAVYDEIQELAQKVNGMETEWCSTTVFTVYEREKELFKKSDFSESIMWDFEGFQYPIPIGYDSILKTIYGDYWKFPPIGERGTWHNNVISNPDKSYKETLKEVYNIGI